MSLTPGTRLGTYEIVAPLGAGGMGEVYRARDTRLGRDVAVKVLPADVSASPDRLARFEREARTVAGLNHPNIVTLYNVEDADGVRFLAMELVEGQTLVDLMTPGGLPLARLLELAIPLTDALTAAHERGVIHRDLKPGNVMVTREGRVKVLDFGLAKVAGDEAAQAQAQTVAVPATGAGELLGTVPYMAPEQLRGEQADARSDLFAFGILLYELATGRRPFTGESSVEVGSSILRDTPQPLTRARPDLPTDLERIVTRCLEKNPRERAQSALDVNNELRRLRRGLEHGDARAPAAADQAASIAVLPFVNRSASADDEYFSDGLADEMINVLAKIKGLRVVARASSFQFKGKNEDLAVIGARLHVAALLDGSVRKAGNRIRVSVQLVNVADSSHLWSETYDRTLDDIFAVQDDIAHSVVKELRTTLLGEAPGSDASGQAKAEVAHAARGRGTNPEAHRLYLLARHVIEHWMTREGFAKGIEYLKQALALDPDFAGAWTELANVYTAQADVGWAPMDDTYRKAREAVERALSLQPDLGEAHVHLAWIQVTVDRDRIGGEASARRALELEPGNAVVLRRAGVLVGESGRTEEAIALHRRAVEQDPLSSSAWSNLGTYLRAADRLAEAEDVYRKAIDLAPSRLGSRACLSLVLLALGRGEEALAMATEEPDPMLRLWSQSMVHHELGHAEESDELLRKLIADHDTEAAFQIAEAYGHRGDADAAFEWLDRAFEQRDAGIMQLKGSPVLRGLHGDPRWETLLRKMGFAE